MGRPARIAHLIKPMKGGRVPSHFIFFDTETFPETIDQETTQHRLRYGFGKYWRRPGVKQSERIEVFPFATGRQWWEWVARKAKPRKRLLVLAHNAIFDLVTTKAFRHLIDLGWKLTSKYAKGHTLILRWRKEKRSIEVFDSLNYFHVPLATMGEWVGLEKPEVDFTTASDSEIENRCQADVEILYRMFRQFIAFLQANDYGRLCATLPAQALTAFRRRYLTKPIHVHAQVDALKAERLAYYGGRVECFFLGRVPVTPVFKLDVNSMYPWVMSVTPVPVRLEGRFHNVTLRELRVLAVRHTMIAYCRLKTGEPVYPFRGKRVIFPIGEFETWLATPEVLYALKNKHLVKCSICYLYRGRIAFRQFVRDAFQLRRKYRRDGNVPFDEVLKRMLNSLYGKFGQRGEDWEALEWNPAHPDGVWDVIHLQTGECYTLRCLGGYVERSVPAEEPYNACPAIAAHITAAARIYLWLLIKQAGRENVFYVDTDSLFVNTEGLERLRTSIQPEKLGYLKVEQVVKRLDIGGLKDYVADGERTLKGLSRKAIQLSGDKFRQEHWPTLIGLLRQGRLDVYRTRTVLYVRHGLYRKGIRLYDGRVVPFRLARGKPLPWLAPLFSSSSVPSAP